MKILAVDDEPSILKLIKLILQADGFEVATAVDGRDALSKLRAESFDLLICDDNMPYLTGYELALGLKEGNLHPAMPVIIVSANFDARRIADLIDRNIINYFIPKPFQMAQLSHAVQLFIKHSAPTCAADR